MLKRKMEENDFPASLGFNDHSMCLTSVTSSLARLTSCKVPIYDARNGPKSFNGDFFGSLHQMPMYTGDLPADSLVTIAFTASIWPMKLTCGRVLDVVGFYIQFVILHAL